MTDPTRSHWTSDEELLEQYVRGQLPAARREAFDEHLHACELCRARVADEKVLSAGIRAAGRKALRRDLADRIARRSAHGTTGIWRWMAAAAVLVAAVGVWRMLTPVAPTPLQLPTMTESSPTPTAEGAKPSEPPMARGSSPRPDRSERRAERTDLDLTPGEPRPTAPPAAGAVAALEEAPREVMADAARPVSEQKDVIEAERSFSGTVEAWVEATVLAPVPVNAEEMARSESDQRTKKLAVVSQDDRPVTRQTGPRGMQLQQAPRSFLPADQRLQATSSVRAGIPARLTLVGDSLFLQLYPVTPYPESEVLEATIFRPRTDSLVVHVGRQLLGLRIPEALLAK